MMITTHFATGFFVAHLLAWYLHISDWKYIAVGVVLAGLPDLDSVYYLLKRKKLDVHEGFQAHRQTFLHAPLFHLVVAAIIINFSFSYGLLYLVAVFSHLIMDTFFVGKGIPWLWPVSRRLYGAWQILAPIYGSVFKEGKKSVRPLEYLIENPRLFILEIIQVSLFLILGVYLFPQT